MGPYKSYTGNFVVRNFHGSIDLGLYLFRDKRDSGAVNKVLQARAKFYRRQANQRQAKSSWLRGNGNGMEFREWRPGILNGGRVG